MITDPAEELYSLSRLTPAQYCERYSLQSSLSWLEGMVNASKSVDIPSVRPATAGLLYMLTKLVNPRAVLELGTGGAVSTAVMASALDSSARLVTVERDFNRYIDAQKPLFRYPNVERVHADALVWLPAHQSAYDLIFLDAAKRDYIDYLPHLERLLNPGGLLVADNILAGGRVINPFEEDRPGYRAGIERLNEFNLALSLHLSFEALSLALDDGLTLARKKS